MKTAFVTKLLTGMFLVGIAICTFLIVRNNELLNRETPSVRARLLNHLAGKLLTQRVAEFRVEKMLPARGAKPPRTLLSWREQVGHTPQGQGLHAPALSIELEGSRPRFEALILEFKARGDSEGSPLEGARIILFRRIYSERLAPQAGFSFASDVQPVPPVYAHGTPPSLKEEELWRQLWHLATDPAAAEKEGIQVRPVARSIATTLEAGNSYRITVEASGLMRLEELPKKDGAARD